MEGSVNDDWKAVLTNNKNQIFTLMYTCTRVGEKSYFAKIQLISKTRHVSYFEHVFNA